MHDFIFLAAKSYPSKEIISENNKMVNIDISNVAFGACHCRIL
jgi:hypothetical protein